VNVCRWEGAPGRERFSVSIGKRWRGILGFGDYEDTYGVSGDRAFARDFLYASTRIFCILALGRAWIRYSSEEFGVAHWGMVTSGSSLMPQRNKDSLERIRGILGVPLGTLTSLFVIMKGRRDYEPAICRRIRTVFDCGGQLCGVAGDCLAGKGWLRLVSPLSTGAGRRGVVLSLTDFGRSALARSEDLAVFIGRIRWRAWGCRVVRTGKKPADLDASVR